MRKLLMLATFFVVGVWAGGAMAAMYVVQGTVTEVVPNTVQVQIPDHTEQCQTIDVPIYGQSSGNGDPVVGNILGAIVGGVVGNQFGGGNGNKAATAAGAAIGAITGGNIARNQGSQQGNVVGYRRETVCNMVERFRYEEKIRDYTVKYEWNGYHGAVVTYNQFNVGDTINLDMDLRAK
jgi:uncharacterized protein YcfJ